MLFSTRFVALAFLVLHLILAFVLPLIDDETYYALWARWPAAGYYDHPPMIAYFIHIGVQVFGENSFGIRIIGLLGMAIASLLVGDTARSLGANEKQSALAALLFNIGFLPLAIGSFATPDAPSTLFWVAGLWAAIKAVQSSDAPKRNRILIWGVAGVLIGLGGVSKFTNVFLGFGLVGWLITTQQGRALLRTPYPYVAIGAALIPLIPYLTWNVQNDWLGFERQGSRLSAGGFSIGHFTGFIAAFILLPTPLVTWFSMRGLRKSSPTQMSLLVWSLVPLLLYFGFHATHDQVQANWLIPIQGAIAVLAVFGLGRLRKPDLWQRLMVYTGAGLSFIFLALVLNPWVPLSTADTPPNQGRGWAQTRTEIQNLIDDTDAQWIATTDYARTGMFAVQFPQMPVHALTELQRYGFRPSFDAALCDTPALLIEKAPRDAVLSKPTEIAQSMFAEQDAPVAVRRTQAGKTLVTYHVSVVQTPSEFGCMGQEP